ncbi:double-cubane-cluster-containing anaerobic reductase [Desulfospira joergensenii]|uniref:double-cubane-cluster-containing anaerobic reductase n=1 Tax=Desulfospira joergensenii TaxID=53329 RepID=UPI0003B323BD|nr:double-cubane-cluster-containing anaerobic reductase [Desulfospira joergensenii]
MALDLPGLIFDQAYIKDIEDRVYERGVALSASGGKIVGLYCAFTPKEVVAAAGGIPVSLCAGSEDPFPAAEEHLPANLCPLIKSSYGHAVGDTCPYFHMTDFLLADATCDGKKKMFELLTRIRPLHLLLLPQSAGAPENFRAWETEIRKAVDFLEKMTGNLITEEKLAGQIRIYNRLRRTVESIFGLNAGDLPLVYGSEITHITSMAGFECDLEIRMAEMESAREKILERAGDHAFTDQMKKRPRILLTGCPTTNKKVLFLIEEAGGCVVAMESCGGLKSVGRRVDETLPPLRALAEKYLNIACACMSPNTGRLDLIGELIRDYRADGVIDLTWNACHTYNVEAFSVREAVQDRFDTPYMQILTDYSENDMGQLETRIQAFLEMIA